MDEIKTLERRIAALERRLARHQRFGDMADKHIPALIAGEANDPAGWKAAVAWWKACSTPVVLSGATAPEENESEGTLG